LRWATFTGFLTRMFIQPDKNTAAYAVSTGF
jgi:hypothetical protein